MCSPGYALHCARSLHRRADPQGRACVGGMGGTATRPPQDRRTNDINDLRATTADRRTNRRHQ